MFVFSETVFWILSQEHAVIDFVHETSLMIGMIGRLPEEMIKLSVKKVKGKVTIKVKSVENRMDRILRVICRLPQRDDYVLVEYRSHVKETIKRHRTRGVGMGRFFPSLLCLFHWSSAVPQVCPCPPSAQRVTTPFRQTPTPWTVTILSLNTKSSAPPRTPARALDL